MERSALSACRAAPCGLNSPTKSIEAITRTEYGDTVPFVLLAFGSRDEHRRAARALKNACKALRLVVQALETLGAVKL